MIVISKRCLITENEPRCWSIWAFESYSIGILAFEVVYEEDGRLGMLPHNENIFIKVLLTFISFFCGQSFENNNIRGLIALKNYLGSMIVVSGISCTSIYPNREHLSYSSLQLLKHFKIDHLMRRLDDQKQHVIGLWFLYICWFRTVHTHKITV